jgi:sterol desaturase/sphingolipid hydroxylase (fatty acid hydroxylase superfamily)
VPVNYIVLAIPVFFVLIALELAITRLQEKQYYSLGDSISDIGTGMIQQLVDVFLKTALFAGYLYVYERHRVATLDGRSAAVWAACFIGVDLLYYWFHRMSHEVNAFWAAHVVHHQSEEFNLAVALRQGAFQGSFSWVFYLPLAWLGFPPLMFLTLSSINTLYQFWIHTRAIGRLGPLEWVLNTPSNHRVHHGRNPKYIDRNHGGTLIVWDRLFGTYAREEEEPVYGITTPLASWNPVWANLHYWADLWRRAGRAARVTDKVRLFLKPPGWNPPDLGGFSPAPEVGPSPSKFQVAIPRGLQAYVLLQFAVVLTAGSVFLFRQQRMDPWSRVAVAAAITASLLVLGALLDARPRAFAGETARLAGAAAFGLVLAGAGWPAGLALVPVAVALRSWVMRYRPPPGRPTDRAPVTA